jgi:hypothetical protein
VIEDRKMFIMKDFLCLVFVFHDDHDGSSAQSFPQRGEEIDAIMQAHPTIFPL